MKQRKTKRTHKILSDFLYLQQKKQKLEMNFKQNINDYNNVNFQQKFQNVQLMSNG